MKLFRFISLCALLVFVSAPVFAQNDREEERFARSGRLSDLANRLVNQSESLGDAAYREYSSRNNNNRQSIEAMILAQQFDATAATFRRLVQDRRSRSELQDAARVLFDIARQSERYSTNRSEWSTIRRTINDIINELNTNGGGGGGNNGYNFLEYSAHIDYEGWLPAVRDGEEAGTTGQSLNMQAIKISLRNISGDVRYRVYVAGRGWTDWSNGGTMSGTTGQALPIDAIRIELRNVNGYNIEYQVHLGYVGWTNWVRNGEVAGQIGRGTSIQAIRIRLVKK